MYMIFVQFFAIYNMARERLSWEENGEFLKDLQDRITVSICECLLTHVHQVVERDHAALFNQVESYLEDEKHSDFSNECFFVSLHRLTKVYMQNIQNELSDERIAHNLADVVRLKREYTFLRDFAFLIRKSVNEKYGEKKIL